MPLHMYLRLIEKLNHNIVSTFLLYLFCFNRFCSKLPNQGPHLHKTSMILSAEIMLRSSEWASSNPDFNEQSVWLAHPQFMIALGWRPLTVTGWRWPGSSDPLAGGQFTRVLHTWEYWLLVSRQGFLDIERSTSVSWNFSLPSMLRSQTTTIWNGLTPNNLSLIFNVCLHFAENFSLWGSTSPDYHCDTPVTHPALDTAEELFYWISDW